MTNSTTARTVGAGKAGLNAGAGVIAGYGAASEYGFFELTLGRVDVGLSDVLDLGLQGAACIGYPGGWLGGEASCEWKVVDDPDSITLSVGGGFEYIYGPAVKAHLFIDSNLSYLPLYAAFKPRLYVATASNETDIVFLSCDLSAGINIEFSECFRFIADYTALFGDYCLPSVDSFGLGVQFIF